MWGSAGEGGERVIERYPKDWGRRAWRKWRTSILRRADDKAVAGQLPGPLQHRGHKDTKHWCRGKVGVEHKPGWRQKAVWMVTPKGQIIQEHVCLECGKRLDYESRVVEPPINEGSEG